MKLPTELMDELRLAVEDCGCELVHVGYGGTRLQVMIDSDDGIDIEDCEQVSKQLSPLLDVHDFGSAEYVLEVTSPGLDRPLFGERDYQRFAGHPARVQWRDGDAKRTDRGTLGEFHPGDGALELTDDRDQKLRIPLAAVLTAQLEIEL